MKSRSFLISVGVICLVSAFLVGTANAEPKKWTKKQLGVMGETVLEEYDDAPLLTGDLTAKELSINSKKLWYREMYNHGMGISAKQLKKVWIDGGGWKDPNQILIDTRQIPEFTQAHIPGAIRVDTGLMPWYVTKVVPNQDATVYLMCKGGDPKVGAIRGAFWAHYMKEMGYTGKLLNITDGFRGWIELGYPVKNNHGMWTFVKGTFQKPDPYLKPDLKDRVRAIKPADPWLHVPGENTF
ncbi:MAG: hypothetical protein JRE28_09125 [Deltaproteobacteria bacterium]|nr:hypothetical protein [Deltaproteobacteria bacterium]